MCTCISGPVSDLASYFMVSIFVLLGIILCLYRPFATGGQMFYRPVWDSIFFVFEGGSHINNCFYGWMKSLRNHHKIGKSICKCYGSSLCSRLTGNLYKVMQNVWGDTVMVNVCCRSTSRKICIGLVYVCKRSCTTTLERCFSKSYGASEAMASSHQLNRQPGQTNTYNWSTVDVCSKFILNLAV